MPAPPASQASSMQATRLWIIPPALLLLGTLLSPAPSRAQMLLDAAGAAAMQGTVNSISVPGSTAILNRARENTAAMSNVQGGGLTTSQPGAPSGPPAPAAAPAAAGTASPRGPQPPAQSMARVNGRSVPTCSHGGLCHGALLRAMGIR